MLFACCIMCVTAGACLPSRTVPTPSGSLLCFYRCHYALTIAWDLSAPVCGRVDSGNPIACSEPRPPDCKP